MHRPVLYHQVLDWLKVSRNEGGRFIDATAGSGGHLKGILANKRNNVLAIEWNEDQFLNLEKIFKKEVEEGRLILKNSNFAEIENLAKNSFFDQVDGVLFDLGLSMNEINSGNRGFSYKKIDEPLDLRLNLSITVTAEKFLNNATFSEIYQVLAKYSEEPNSARIASLICKSRRKKPLKRVLDLTEIIDKFFVNTEKIKRRIFQALRIFVNDEISNLKKGLLGVDKVLKTGGIIAVITFHSIEDRVVKMMSKKLGWQSLALVKNERQFMNKEIFAKTAKLRVYLKNKDES